MFRRTCWKAEPLVRLRPVPEQGVCLAYTPARPALHARLDAVLPAIHALPEARRARWSLDVDPVDLY